MKLTYQPLPNDDVLRVSAQGLVSVRALPKSSEPLLDLLGPHCYREKVILNLERTDGVDTSGLMWLVRAASHFAEGGGRLVVYGFSPLFRNMLEVLGLTALVPLSPSEALAIAAASQGETDRVPPRPHPKAFTGNSDAN